MVRAVIPFLILLQCGCFGGSQNPSYFPFYLPTGDIIRTHAKPPGVGYFRNFDPKACRIEVTPANASNPLRSQVILVAAVFDKDNEARRKRRVEWTLEGPGSIVEVDESGYMAGRGYQVTEKFAVSYTDMTSHTLKRGPDKKDEFTIEAGQTWCVVSSPVPGETIVTAYAPEVQDWEKRRAFARLVWGDGGFVPVPGMPSSIRSGRETDSTLWEKLKKDGPTSNEAALLLDARMPKAMALNRESTAVISLANSGRQESAAATLRATIPEGTEITRADPPPNKRSGRDLIWTLDRVPGGQTRDVTLTVKPTRSGALALTASAETTDGLKANTRADSYADTAGLKVTVEPPTFAAVNETADIRIVVTNPGQVPVDNAVVWMTPDALLGTQGGTVPVEVRVGTINAGASRTVNAPLTAVKSGKAKVRVDVTADGGLSARGEGTLTIGKAELQVKVVGPETVPVGESATYEVQVVNGGDVPATNVAVTASLPRGMVAKPDANASGDTALWKLATLAPGEKQTFRVTATGDRLSELGSVTASATGTVSNGGKLPIAKTSAPAAVRGTPVLTLELLAPAATVPVNGKVQYRVVVRNRGTGPARDLVVNVSMSDGLKATSGDLMNRIDELAPGAAKTFTIDADAVTVGESRASATLQAKELPNPLREEQSIRITRR